MVQVNNKYIKFWELNNTSIVDKDALLIVIQDIENKMNLCFPVTYGKLMMQNDGGGVKYSSYKYFDKYRNEIMYGSIWMLSLLNGYYSVYQLWLDPPEFFPNGLVPFADDGGGNLTCFDYRKTKKDPPIVFWVHDDPEGEDVHFIANNFEEFINMLHEPRN